EFTDILKLSRVDLGWLLPDEALAGAAARLLEAGPQVGVVTCSDQGARLFTWQGEQFQPAFAVEEVDSIGAGDSFMAGFLAELSRHGFPLSDGAALTRSLRWAAASAALNCRQPGAQPPTSREVAAFLATQPPYSASPPGPEPQP
ncbi:MAG: PfkB family carbohydrate kinase, partial [Deinococcus sp.]